MKLKLDGLSVEELESLQLRVSKEITKRLCEKAVFESWDFCPPDDRSYGNVSFTVKTKHGVLSFEAMLGDGYSDDAVVSLDGVESDGYDLQVPDFHENTTDDVAKQECAKAVLEWESSYEPAEVEA